MCCIVYIQKEVDLRNIVLFLIAVLAAVTLLPRQQVGVSAHTIIPELPEPEMALSGVLADNHAAISESTEKPMIFPADGNITSGYGWREGFAGNNFEGMHFHQALDFAGSIGDPVKAAMSGTVAYINANNYLGNYMILKHGEYQTLYAHLSAFSVTVGEEVEQGQHIAAIGNSGFATGPHLHFEVFQNGNRINPLDVLK